MRRGQVGQRPPAATTEPATATTSIDTKEVGEPDHHNSDPTRFGDWLFMLKSYIGALDSQQLFEWAEQLLHWMLNSTRDATDATLSE